MTPRALPLHEWKPWEVLLVVGASAGAVLMLAMIGIAFGVLRAAGVGS